MNWFEFFLHSLSYGSASNEQKVKKDGKKEDRQRGKLSALDEGLQNLQKNKVLTSYSQERKGEI